MLIKIYLKSIIRSLFKNKIFSSIKILGLSISIVCNSLIFVYVYNEYSFDTFHQDADLIYLLTIKTPTRSLWATPPPLGSLLHETFNEIISATNIRKSRSTVKHNNKIFEEDIFYTDQSFFTYFSFPLEYGRPDLVLKDPDSIVLSHEMALKYFGNKNPVDEIMYLKQQKEFKYYRVTGVTKPIPENSSLQFGFVVNFDESVLSEYKMESEWDLVAFATFIKLKNRKEETQLIDKLNNFDNPSLGDVLRKYYRINRYGLEISPFTNHHLDKDSISSSISPLEPPIDSTYLHIFIIVGLVLLLISSLNYVNLSLGDSLSRIKEIYMHRVVGSYSIDMANRFILESFVFTSLSLVLAIGIIAILLAFPGNFFSELVDASQFMATENIVFALLLVVGISGIAGYYPMLFLSRIKIKDIVSGNFKIRSTSFIKLFPIVFQFTVTIALIIIIINMWQQNQLLFTKELGFDKSNVVMIPMNNWPDTEINNSKFQVFKSELLKNTDISFVSGAEGAFGSGFTIASFRDPKGNINPFEFIPADHEFIKTFNIKIIEGRDFSPDHISDAKTSSLVNESFTKYFNTDDYIGKNISSLISEKFPNTSKGLLNYYKAFNIIGIVKDFHIRSLHARIAPTILILKPTASFRINVKLTGVNIQETLTYIEEKFSTILVDQPFSYSFLEDGLKSLYTKEDNWISLIFYSAAITIFVTCLGLFGSTLLIMRNKLKEIGIRKVLGASTINLVYTSNKNVLHLVLASNLTAWPIGYWGMHYWLESFAYRIDIGLSTFVLSGFIAIIIATITISSVAVKIANANLSDVLRQV